MATPNQLSIEYGTTSGSAFAFPTDDLHYSVSVTPLYRQDEKCDKQKVRIGDIYNVMARGFIDGDSATDLLTEQNDLRTRVTKEWGSKENTTAAALLTIKMGSTAVHQWLSSSLDNGFHCKKCEFGDTPEKHLFFVPFAVEWEFIVKTIGGNILEKDKVYHDEQAQNPNEGSKKGARGYFVVAPGGSASSAAATLVTTTATGYVLEYCITRMDEDDRRCDYEYSYQKELTGGSYPSNVTGQEVWINYTIDGNNKKRWCKSGWYEGSGASAAAAAAIPGAGTAATLVVSEIEQNQNTGGRVYFRYEWDAVATGTDYMRWEASVRQYELRRVSLYATGGAGNPAHFKGPLQGYIVEERGSAAHPSAYPSVPAALYAEGANNCTIALAHTPQKLDVSLNEKRTDWFRQYFFSAAPGVSAAPPARP